MMMRPLVLHLAAVIVCYFVICEGAQPYRGQRYEPGDAVPLFVNTIGPYSNPSVTYEYYDLPFCQPPGEKIQKAKQTMGMAIDGVRLYSAMYEHRFAVPISNKLVCNKQLNKEEISQFVNAVKKTFIYQMYADGIPAYGFVGTGATDPTDPEQQEMQYYLFTHIHFQFMFNGDRMIYFNVTADTDSSHLVLLDESKESMEVQFTYSSSWEPTEFKFSDRAKLQKVGAARRMEIHWLSILNSVGLVLLLTGFLAVIINRILKKDISRYSKSHLAAEEEEDVEDYGWKLVAGDVFRFPKYKTYLCAFLGVGCQLLFVSFSLLLLSIVGILYPEQMGSIYSAAVVVFVLASGVSGLVSGGFYKKLQGEKWTWNLVLAATLFAVPTASVSAAADIIARFYHSTSALPVATGIQIFVIWACIGFPLTIVGGIAGRRMFGPFSAPVRTKNAVREIPSIPFYRQAPVQFLIGGFLPFSAIYIELHYIYTSLWGHSSYGLYSILLLVFIILLLVTACMTIALTYFQLSVEDHNWWWRSFFSAGSTGFFVFGYSVYFYVYLSRMNGFLQVVKYFSFVTISCYFFFVMLGTVGFYSSLLFVKHIYGTLKIE